MAVTAPAIVVAAPPAAPSAAAAAKVTFAAAVSEEEGLLAALSHASAASRLRAVAELLADAHGPAAAVRLEGAVRRQLRAESEPVVQEALVRAAAHLAAHPYVNAAPAAEALLAMCTPAALEALERLLRVKSLALATPSLVRRLLAAKAKLRAAALVVLARQLPPRDAQSVLVSCATDPAARVRLAALRGLLALEPAQLDLTHAYACAAARLTDVEAGVRAAATRLIWALASLHPNAQVPSALAASVAGAGGAGLVRQVDEAFVRLCGQVGDTDKGVRRLACQLLGSLSGAHPTLLLQTFSKQLLAVMRPATGRAVQLMAVDGPGEGADWDAADDVSLVDAAAAGAFVHGLEDEYAEVRAAAVDAVCELAVRRADSLGARAAEVVADAVHDEIDALRLNALQSLRKIAAAAPDAAAALAAEQLQTLLSLAADAQAPMRHATYRLVAHLRLGSLAALRAALHALLAASARHPATDTEAVLGTLAALGAAHAAQAELLVEEALGLDRRFVVQEARPDEPAYVALLVFFAAAAAHNASLAPLLPAFARRHYGYLRAKHPRLLPPLPPPPLAAAAAARPDAPAQLAPPALPADLVARLLFAPLAAAAAAPHPDSQHLSSLLSRACQEARATAEAEGERGGWCAFVALVGSALLRPLVQGRGGVRVAEELVAATYRLEQAFAGLSLALCLHLRLWRVHAHLLLVRAAPSGSALLRSPLGARGGPVEQLAEAVAHAVRFAADAALAPPPPLAALHATLQALPAAVALDALLAAPAVAAFRPPVALPACVLNARPTRATLHVRGAKGEGASAERPVQLAAGVATALHVEAHVAALGGAPDALLLAVGPDTLPLQGAALVGSGALGVRVACAVRVSAARAWTEAAAVRVQLARRFTPDLPSHPPFVPLSPPVLLHLAVRP